MLALAAIAFQRAVSRAMVSRNSTTVVEFRELIARDAARWKAVAAKANIKLA